VWTMFLILCCVVLCCFVFCFFRYVSCDQLFLSPFGVLLYYLLFYWTQQTSKINYLLFYWTQQTSKINYCMFYWTQQTSKINYCMFYWSQRESKQDKLFTVLFSIKHTIVYLTCSHVVFNKTYNSFILLGFTLCSITQ
jgi:hypothetical protein